MLVSSPLHVTLKPIFHEIAHSPMQMKCSSNTSNSTYILFGVFSTHLDTFVVLFDGYADAF